ncbi:hypothetical protein ACROYT_G015165 [Oculina patagonica]
MASSSPLDDTTPFRRTVLPADDGKPHHVALTEWLHHLHWTTRHLLDVQSYLQMMGSLITLQQHQQVTNHNDLQTVVSLARNSSKAAPE